MESDWKASGKQKMMNLIKKAGWLARKEGEAEISCLLFLLFCFGCGEVKAADNWKCGWMRQFCGQSMFGLNIGMD